MTTRKPQEEFGREAQEISRAICVLISGHHPMLASTALLDAMAIVLAADPNFNISACPGMGAVLQRLVQNYRPKENMVQPATPQDVSSIIRAGR